MSAVLTNVRYLAASLILALPLSAHASIVGISGTMSNFDVFNETGTNAYGAELELEGVHSSDLTKTFPSHFNSMAMTDYSTGTTFGTRVTFTGYNFDPAGYLIPTVGQSTNGHYAVNIKGAEHFGFAVASQPTATRFYWLDQGSQRIGTMPLAIPGPTWTYVPPAIPNNPPVIQAVVQVPEPAEAHAQMPDSIWMKVYVTEMEREVDLMELLSGPGIVPQGETEVETEWELLEGGKMSQSEVEVSEKGVSIVRRYEFFQYTGAYSEEHEPLSTYTGVGEPPANELGQFIAANMVAAVLEVPEPSTLAWLLALALPSCLARRRLFA
ncbi:MAG: hypothetical protein ACM359_07925 [Bacillota bacterium]